MLWVCPHALNLPDSFHSIFIISDLSLPPEDFSVSWNPSLSTSSLIIFAPTFYWSCVWSVCVCLSLSSYVFSCFTDEVYMYNNVVIKSILRTLKKRYCKIKKVHLSSTKFLWLHWLLAQRCDVALRPWRSKCNGATDMVHQKGSEKPFRPAGIIWGAKAIKLKVMQFVSSSRRVHPSFSSLLPLFALIVSCNLSTPRASLPLVLIFIESVTPVHLSLLYL